MHCCVGTKPPPPKSSSFRHRFADLKGEVQLMENLSSQKAQQAHPMQGTGGPGSAGEGPAVAEARGPPHRRGIPILLGVAQNHFYCFP